MSLDVRIEQAGYGPTTVLRDVELLVEPGEIVALLGANGAGKSTTIGVVAGLNRSIRGRITLDGEDLTRASAEARPGRGVAHVPEGRQLFPALSVEDNLELGAFSRRVGRREAMATVFELFPVLGQRRRQRAGSLSGGEAQMLALGRALMCRPRYLLMDEPSLGLAPLLVGRVFDALASLADDGVGVLLAEQNASKALGIADRGMVLDRGRVGTSGTSAELLDDAHVAESYLGGTVR